MAVYTKQVSKWRSIANSLPCLVEDQARYKNNNHKSGWNNLKERKQYVCVHVKYIYNCQLYCLKSSTSGNHPAMTLMSGHKTNVPTPSKNLCCTLVQNLRQSYTLPTSNNPIPAQHLDNAGLGSALVRQSARLLAVAT